MVKLFQTQHEFKHPWTNVSAAFWRKYPNDQSPHVKEVDTFIRSISSDGNQLSVGRLVRVESSLPGWLSALNVPSSCYAVETTTVDRSTQTLTIRSRNLTGSSVMVVEEECVYRPSQVNDHHTSYTQSANITSFLPVFSSKCEQWSLSNFTAKSKVGLDTMEKLCAQVKQDGIHSLVDQLAKLEKKFAVVNNQLERVAEDLALPRTRALAKVSASSSN